jgi:Chaperone of endosialidase
VYRLIRTSVRLGLLWSVVIGMFHQQGVYAQNTSPASAMSAAGGVADASMTAPALVSFTGVLKDETGKPLTGVQGVTFALYKSQSEGPALWIETQNVNADAEGRFAVLLGANSSKGLPLDLFTTGQAQWIGVQANGQSEQPRVFLTSVPYALATIEGRNGNLPPASSSITKSDSPSVVSNAGPPIPALTTSQVFEGTAASGPNFVADATSGPPLQVSSNVRVPNLNADLVDGLHAAAFPLLVGNNTFSGNQTINGNLNLPNTTSTSGIITFGGQRYFHNFGPVNGGNTFVGENSGNLNQTGTLNTAVGRSTLQSNTTGFHNTVIGVEAMQSNTTGYQNTVNGYEALRSNSTGHHNIATGVLALASNTTGNENTAIGTSAMQFNTTGVFNTATGSSALNNNTVGFNNTANGTNALVSNTTGNNNTATGMFSLLANTTGSNNTALGWQAGFTATPANANATGSNNTFLGYNAGPGSSTQLNNATAIGANALVSADNSLVLGDTAVKVGIGTSTPTEKLEVVGNAKITGTGNGIKFPDGTTQTTAATGGGGDITAVTAGGGLSGGGTSGDVTLAVDTSAIQNRVSGSCAIGSSIRVVNADGSVTCQADSNSGGTVTSISTGLGLMGGPITTTGTVAIDTSVVPRLAAANVFTATQTIDSGNLDLDTSTATTGNITKNGTRFLHNFGFNNTFVGAEAGNFTMAGDGNVGAGTFALRSNTNGAANVAIGSHALQGNTTGFDNTAIGEQTLQANTSGIFNTAVGAGALITSTGSNNVAVGLSAGANATTGSNNIYLGTTVLGVAGESNTIYVGKQGTQTKTFIAGIRGITTVNSDAIPVMIDSAGQLGTVSSSSRFKEDINDMGDASQRLLQLRPVTFRYAQAYGDGSKPIQYGLIAEEVAKVFPELAVRNAAGEIETVHYETLNVLLLNELRKHQSEIQRQRERIEVLEQRMNEVLRLLNR